MIEKKSNHLKAFSRENRKNSTFGEILLWKELKNRNLLNKQFYRQKPIGRFILDFYCAELKIAIEIDGNSHFFDDKKLSDSNKQQYLLENGYHLLRFTEKQVRFERKEVIKTIEKLILSLI